MLFQSILILVNDLEYKRSSAFRLGLICVLAYRTFHFSSRQWFRYLSSSRHPESIYWCMYYCRGHTLGRLSEDTPWHPYIHILPLHLSPRNEHALYTSSQHTNLRGKIFQSKLLNKKKKTRLWTFLLESKVRWNSNILNKILRGNCGWECVKMWKCMKCMNYGDWHLNVFS